MEIMIAQHDGQPPSVLIRPSQDFERGWPAIDEITDEPKGIPIRIPLNALEQSLERQPAAVYVTDCPCCHPFTLHAARTLSFTTEASLAIAIAIGIGIEK
jgi:hypothetical protein